MAATNTAQLKDFRSKIAASMELLEKLTTEVSTYKELPIVHGNLQAKVRTLAQALYFLQVNAYSKQSEESVAQEKAILEEDIQAINQR